MSDWSDIHEYDDGTDDDIREALQREINKDK